MPEPSRARDILSRVRQGSPPSGGVAPSEPAATPPVGASAEAPASRVQSRIQAIRAASAGVAAPEASPKPRPAAKPSKVEPRAAAPEGPTIAAPEMEPPAPPPAWGALAASLGVGALAFTAALAVLAVLFGDRLLPPT